MDVIGLLQSKRRCLRRFLEISQGFLAELDGAEDSGAGAATTSLSPALDGLGEFESRREAAIKTLGMIDKRITEVVRAMPTESRTAELSRAVQDGLDEEARLVQSILATDNRIMTHIERAKRRLTQDMAQTRRSHALTGRFKSTWVPEPGEGLDQEI
jgi:hypothetical protein